MSRQPRQEMRSELFIIITLQYWYTCTRIARARAAPRAPRRVVARARYYYAYGTP